MDSLKHYYWERGHEICATCVYCDDYAFNVYDDLDLVPHGYDGSAWCNAFDKDKPKTKDNRNVISPCWGKCSKYKKCSEAQSLYEEIYDSKLGEVIKNPHPPTKYDFDDEEDGEETDGIL